MNKLSGFPGSESSEEGKCKNGGLWFAVFYEAVTVTEVNCAISVRWVLSASWQSGFNGGRAGMWRGVSGPEVQKAVVTALPRRVLRRNISPGNASSCS